MAFVMFMDSIIFVFLYVGTGFAFVCFAGVNILSTLTYLILFEILRYILFIYLHLLIKVDKNK